ncbi:MAG: hypothetical protein KGO50_10500 [Myxococcales bacterium]|nr:hypothetical protein [Myxococcales bacterium]
MRTTFAFATSALTLLLLVGPANAQESAEAHATPLPAIALNIAPSAATAAADEAPDASAPQWVTPSHQGDELQAQYFDNGTGGPQQGAGYFPDVPRESIDDLVIAPTYGRRTVLAAFHLGGGLNLMSLKKVDNSFFLPNEADGFAFTVPATIEAGGYMEFAGLVRVGVVGNGYFAAARNRGASGGSLGGTLEFGGGDVWRFWGGVVVGGRWISADAQDDAGRDYGWNARFLHYRLHGHVERQLNPWVSLRLTPWLGLGTLRDETFDVPLPRDAPSNVIPADSGYREFSAGLLFSVVLGTGR